MRSVASVSSTSPTTSGRSSVARVPAAGSRPAAARPRAAWGADTRAGRPATRHVPRSAARSGSHSGAASASWARARSPSRAPGTDPPLWDCIGLGEALVDCCAAVDDAFLAEFGVAKGGRR